MVYKEFEMIYTCTFDTTQVVFYWVTLYLVIFY
jgi:hypothetical protein